MCKPFPPPEVREGDRSGSLTASVYNPPFSPLTLPLLQRWNQKPGSNSLPAGGSQLWFLGLWKGLAEPRRLRYGGENANLRARDLAF